jgi:glycosyltransferase involved in cell wall biosynthesis
MCYAFEQIGVDVTLAIPAGFNCKSESQMYKAIESKLGRTPNFSVRPLGNFTIGGRLVAIGSYLGVKSLLKCCKNIDFCFTRVSFIAHLTVKSGIRTIYESHGIIINHKNGVLDSIYHRCLLRDAQSRNLILFIAISNALAKVWQERGVPAQKIVALHDGFCKEDYKVLTSRKRSRKTLGIKSENKIVVYSGSLYEDRGIENILRLAKAFPHVHFYIVGGPEKSKDFYKIRSAQEGLSNVFLTGYVPYYKVKDYLFAADVLLMLWSRDVPNIKVCSPLKVFEYMAAERIIVGHGFPVIKEVLTDGKTALLAAPDSYEDLERKLHYALSLNYPNDIARNARNVVFNNYSWQRRAAAIVEAIE